MRADPTFPASPPRTLATSPFERKIAAFLSLSDEERSALNRLYHKTRRVAAGKDLIRQGQKGQTAYLLIDGWACSYKLIQDGGRQVVNIQVPGDFLGLRSVLFHTADHSVETITDTIVCEIGTKDLLESFATLPRLATAILWTVSRDEAMVVEHLVCVGRRSALQRVAHFLLELGARLSLVGLGSQNGYSCPLNQYVLADTLGLTPVHLNRVLRRLREIGLVTVRCGDVVFDDFDRLVDLAEFDSGYLDQSGSLLR